MVHDNRSEKHVESMKYDGQLVLPNVYSFPVLLAVSINILCKSKCSQPFSLHVMTVSAESTA